MNHRRRSLSLTFAASCAATAAALLAVLGAAEPKPAEQLPAPCGEVIGDARVCVVARSDHGDPAGVPFAHVSGAYRLTGFPYAAPQRSSSIVFLREGHLPRHVALATPRPDAPAPRLGKTLLLPLPEKTGCVAGLLIERDEQGIDRYLSGELTATLVGQEDPAVRLRTREQGFFCQPLIPGFYRIAVEGTDEMTLVDVEAGRTAWVTFARLPSTEEITE